MDFFENSHWRLTKFLLCCVGCWPFQTPNIRQLLQLLAFISVGSIFIPEIIKLIVVRNDRNLAIECVPIFALHLLTLVKFFNCLSNMQKTKLLLIQIRRDWQSSLLKEEIEILHRDTQFNKIITHSYIYYIYATTLMFLLTPLSPRFLDFILPLNGSRPSLPLYQTDYFVLDPVKYEVPILFHAYIVSPIPSTIIVAFDALYANLAIHACGMFLCVGNKLEHTVKSVNFDSHGVDEQGIYKSLVVCIKKHRKVLEYCHLLESTYSTTLIFILMINMVALSITGFQTVMNMNEINEMIRFGTFSIGQLVHLFFFTYPGQKLMDHSGCIYQSIHRTNWYDLPLKSKRLLVMVMMRSRKPCKLRAGGFYTMTSKNFSKVIQKSISYFTVLTSAQ